MASPIDYVNQMKAQYQQFQQGNQGSFGGGYLDSGNFDTSKPNVAWEDFVRQLGFSNLANMTDFNSPLYQQYAQYLQKTTQGIGVNSLLAPLMAGGAGYAGGQAIASQQAQGMNKQRQDKINTGVQQFAVGNQQNVLGQLGQLGGSFATTLNRNAMDAQTAAQNNPFNQLGGMLGSFAGLLNPFGGSASKMGAQPVGGYNG